MMPPTGGMPQGMGPGMGMMPSMGYSQRTQYTYTGIAGLSGGYAYEPGSGMCQFLDNLNNTMANASMMGQMGGGMPQQPMGGQQGKGNSGNMMIQMLGMMFGMLITKLAPVIKQRLAERQAAQSEGTSSSGHHKSTTSDEKTTPKFKKLDENDSPSGSDNN